MTDPQLHTHGVVLNVTQRADGQWRALDNEPLYRNKMLLGALYRSELAEEVQAPGYEVRITHGDGRFELAHVSNEQLKAFSQRSNAIEEAPQRRGLTREDASARQLQTVALQTRQGNETLDRSALHAEWRERAREAGLNLDARPTTGVASDPQRQASHAQRAVHFAAAHLMTREALQASLAGKPLSDDLTEAQRLLTVSYQSGDVVRADRDYTALGLERGDFARVVDCRAGVVTLERADGQHVEWRPVNEPHLVAFTEQQRELAAGDVVRFTHSDHRAGIVNGERATVASIDAEQGRIVLDKPDGTRLAQRLDA